MANCPNKSHPDWKALVTKHGEKGAYLKYVQNGFKIPSQENIKKSSKQKITVKERFDAFGSVFKSKDTLATMEDNPDVASKIIDELNKLRPDVRVFKDRIIDENGNYLDIPSDKMGRHYRSAFMSAVAWSNDSSLETPPHEYVHDYIDMFRNTPIVKKAIEKYGEERLVTLIARKYTGQKMSNSYKNTLKNIWKTIRMVFGATSVIDILTDSFARNEQLGKPLSRGTAIHNFQDIAKPMIEKDTPINFNEDINDNAEKINILSEDEVRSKIFDSLDKKYKFLSNEEEQKEKFREWWRQTKMKAAKVTRMDGGANESSNYSSMDQSIMKYVDDLFAENSENITQIIAKIKGEDITLTNKQIIALNNIYNMVKGILYRSKINHSYINPDIEKANLVDDSIVDKISIDEVTNHLKKKAKRLASKNQVLRWIDKTITKKLKWVTNPRLWAKYISGSENSMVSRVLYKGLNNGRENFSEYNNTFKKIFKSKPTSLYEGSSYVNKNLSIDELNTETIELDPLKNLNAPSSIKLTKGELLVVYLMNRQRGGKANLAAGIHLNNVKGRNLKSSANYILTEKQISDIVNKIEADPELKEFITEIDKAMEYSHDELNKVHRLMEGFDLEKIEKYYPTFHGKESNNIRKSKNVVENMRNFRLKSAEGLPVRLVDPFKTLADLRMANASYIGYAIPVHNAQKMVDSLKNEGLHTEDNDIAGYINMLQDNINQIQDNGLLFSTQSGDKSNKLINKINGNFAIALLGYNPGVTMIQQVSLETAASEINRKYIRKSGASLGGLNFINPIDLLKRLTFKGDKTKLPIEWKQITDNETYKTLMKYPLLMDRLEGMISRETGEAVMGKTIQEDLITIPFMKDKNGKRLKISKSRFMMGITIMDSLTIMRLYEAVKLETADRMGEAEFSKLSKDEIELHNINRLQQIIDKTQPTFDQTNRTGLAKDSNPIFRILTIFSSANQKIGEQLIDSMVDYNNNPTPENLKKFGARVFQTAITTSIMLTTINILSAMAKGNWDDDDFDKIPEDYFLGAFKTSLGSFHGVESVLDVVFSQLDSKPWHQTLQNPFISIIQEGSEGIANVAKINFLKALKNTTNTVFKVTGIPVTPINTTKNYIEKVTD